MLIQSGVRDATKECVQRIAWNNSKNNNPSGDRCGKIINDSVAWLDVKSWIIIGVSALQFDICVESINFGSNPSRIIANSIDIATAFVICAKYKNTQPSLVCCPCFKIINDSTARDKNKMTHIVAINKSNVIANILIIHLICVIITISIVLK